MNNNIVSNKVLELSEVTVKYGFSKALDNVSFVVNTGMTLGLIGANGAGKTTSIRAFLGMIRLSQGQVRVFGENKLTPKLLQKIGFAPEDATPPEYLSAQEYMGFLSKYKNTNKNSEKSQIADLLNWFDLEPNKPIRKYSKGMRRRLILAQAFLGNPDLIILDEPLNGLDPIMIQKLREKIIQYRAAGTSILYSSHILAELETSCTDVVMMDKGKVVLQGTVAQLKEKYGSVEKAFSCHVGGSSKC